MRMIDVNILLDLVNRSSAHHEKIQRWWKAALADSEPIALPWAATTGFMRIATHPKLLPEPLSLEEAIEVVEGWLSHSKVSVIRESDNHYALFLGLLREVRKGGNLVPDAHLAAIAIGHNATLSSCDTDFARFGKLRWENPLG